MTMPAENKRVQLAYCDCCKQTVGVHADGRFAWHDYPPIFDGYSVEGSFLGLCYMSGKTAPNKKEGKTVDPVV